MGKVEASCCRALGVYGIKMLLTCRIICSSTYLHTSWLVSSRGMRETRQEIALEGTYYRIFIKFSPILVIGTWYLLEKTDPGIIFHVGPIEYCSLWVKLAAKIWIVSSLGKDSGCRQVSTIISVGSIMTHCEFVTSIFSFSHNVF